MAKLQKNTDSEDLITVTIPRQNKLDTQRFVSVNGERILIQTGVPVKIPRRFAEALENSDRAAAEADEYIYAHAQ